MVIEVQLTGKTNSSLPTVHGLLLTAILNL